MSDLDTFFREEKKRMELPDESDEDYLVRRHRTRFVGFSLTVPVLHAQREIRCTLPDYKPLSTRASGTKDAVPDEVPGIPSHNDILSDPLEEPEHNRPSPAGQRQSK